MGIIEYSIEDVKNIEGNVYLVDHRMFIQDKTTTTHNAAIAEISTSLRLHIATQGGKCKVYTENVALYANELCDFDGDFYLPDVMVVCNTEGIKEDGIHTAPLFVAEITSDSTKTNDYGRKKDIYQAIGVQEYWIVDVQRKLVFKYLESEEYIPQPFLHPQTMEVSVYPGLEINLSEFMDA